VDRINKVVATVVPHLVEAIQDELSGPTTTSSTIAVVAPPTTTPTTVEKISKVVATAVPQLVEAIQRELTPTITPPSITTVAVPSLPPLTCGVPQEPLVSYYNISPISPYNNNMLGKTPCTCFVNLHVVVGCPFSGCSGGYFSYALHGSYSYLDVLAGKTHWV
jgi:hypothetical protein